MEIIQKFGLETHLFIFQLINFLIIVLILRFFLFKPIQKVLEERKRKIDQSIADAQAARTTLENAGQERNKIIAQAKADSDKISADVKVALEETKAKMTAEAKQRSQQIIEDAKQRADSEFENLNKEVGKISLEVSQKIMSKVFAEVFSDEDKEKVLAKAVEKMEKMDYEKISN